jgi:hypothetical protein
MKRGALSLTIVVVLVCGCQKHESRPVAWHERRQFQAVIATKLKQLDRSIAQLPSIATEQDSAYAVGIEDLKRGERKLRVRFDAMTTASDEEWPALKDSMEFYYHRIREQYENIADIARPSGTAPADSSIVHEKVRTN